MLQDEAYEEVFTVSASSDTSHNQSDSEIEGTTEVLTLPAHVTSVSSPKTRVVSHVTSPINHGISPSNGTAFSNKGTTCLIKSSNNTVPRTAVTPRAKTPTLVDSSSQKQSSRQNSTTPDIISKCSEQDATENSLKLSKRLSRSCDSLDTSCQVGIQNQDFGTSQSERKHKGKFKAHRQKGRRAVTLHNLDTKQLMLILNLQMRYLEETKAYQSQKDIQSVPSPRRAITPQPSTHQPKIPQNIRSHTPQPYRRQNVRVSEQERDFYAQINSLYQYHNKQYETNEGLRRKDQLIPKENVKNNVPYGEVSYNPYLYRQRGTSADNIHYVTYSDNMLNLKGPKPKSRATVQDYFLPPQPLHRHNRNTLPPQPVRRQKCMDQNLPSEPSHRGKSAFHIVDCGRNNSHSSSVSSERSDEVCSSENVSLERKCQSDYAEVAIRDNFQLNQSPYMFKNSHSRRLPIKEQKTHAKFADISSKSIKSYMCSEIPPPYTGPPSYLEFVSSCENSATSSTSSNQEEIYSRPVRKNIGQNSVDDKYVFEIETRNLLKSERNQNYNVRQPNLDSVYGYTETLNDVQNCHGDIKLTEVRAAGHSASGQFKEKSSESHVRENVYNTPAKSKVKQCIVPEDYYTPVHKVSRQNPVYANAKNVAERKDNLDAKDTLSKSHNQSPILPESSLHYDVSDRDKTYVECVDKFNGYVYPEINQATPDAKCNEYEDVYDTPEGEADEPVLVSYKEIGDLHDTGEIRNGQSHLQPNFRKLHNITPKKSKTKLCTDPENNQVYLNGETPSKDGLSQTIQKVHNPKYIIPAIQVNDDDITENEVFITDQVYGNCAKIQMGGDKDRKHFKEIHNACQGLNPGRDIECIADHKYSVKDSNDVTRMTVNPSLESDQLRQIPDGTDEHTPDIINSSEDECAETGV